MIKLTKKETLEVLINRFYEAKREINPERQASLLRELSIELHKLAETICRKEEATK